MNRGVIADGCMELDLLVHIFDLKLSYTHGYALVEVNALSRYYFP